MTRQIYRLLLAEDDEGDVALMKEAFRSNGIRCELEVASDGVETMDALRRGREAGSLPHLVLLDLNMPRMNGRDVLREVKADPTLASVPIVVFSTSPSQRDISECYALNANSYVTKPTDLASFRDTVATMKRYWFSVSSSPVSV